MRLPRVDIVPVSGASDVPDDWIFGLRKVWLEDMGNEAFHMTFAKGQEEGLTRQRFDLFEARFVGLLFIA